MDQKIEIETGGKRFRFAITTSDLEAHSLFSDRPECWRAAVQQVKSSLHLAIQVALTKPSPEDREY